MTKATLRIWQRSTRTCTSRRSLSALQGTWRSGDLCQHTNVQITLLRRSRRRSVRSKHRAAASQLRHVILPDNESSDFAKCDAPFTLVKRPCSAGLERSASTVTAAKSTVLQQKTEVVLLVEKEAALTHFALFVKEVVRGQPLQIDCSFLFVLIGSFKRLIS